MNDATKNERKNKARASKQAKKKKKTHLYTPTTMKNMMKKWTR